MFDFFLRDEVRTAIRRRLVLLVFLAALPTYLALGARSWWVLELATHFCVLYLIALVPAVLIVFYWQRWKLLAWVAIALAINLWLVVPLYFDFGYRGNNTSPTFRLLLANVLSKNQQHSRLLQVIESENPDVVVLFEVNRAWCKSLGELEKKYPYTLVKSREDNFGVCLYSKLPTDKLQIVKIGPSGVPSIEAALRFRDATVQIVATHPLPPGSRENAIHRNRHLNATAEKLAGLPNPRFLVGDLNITPWSPFFDDLLQGGRLQNSQQGFGVQPTWFGVLPIDHILHSSDISVINRRVGPRIGSDHQPVIIDMAISRGTD